MNKEYIVLSRQDAVARNNSPYINLKMANLEGVENVCVFDVPKTSGPKVGQLVRFLNIRDNQGKKSATNMDMIVGTFPTEQHPLYTLVPRPVKREIWDATIKNLLTFCKNDKLKGFIREQADVLFPQYSKYPAATSVHHAFKGGLLNHTWQMLHLLEGIYPVYPYPDDIKVDRIIISTMVLSGAICGIAGLLLVGSTDHTLTTTLAGGNGCGAERGPRPGAAAGPAAAGGAVFDRKPAA